MTDKTDRMIGMARKAHVEMERRYFMHRPRVTDDQAGEILCRFCHGSGSVDISAATGIPLSTVRAIISYVCYAFADLYKWHMDSIDGSYGAKNPAPASAAAYIHFAPPI